ncbi:MAG: cadherin repeat domain-containing protein, partial [Deltaproteobacteria bacterium]|nr:cadherin repeat domain-containing protein [Deltaproteobacteria bacterium]
TYGPGPESYSASTWVEVGLSAELEELELLPEHLAFDQLGQTFQIRVVGHFNDGSQHELTAGSAGTSYSTLSAATAVVSVTSEGVVEAQGAGQDIVMVSHSGLWAQTTVEVSFTNRPPSLSPLPEVTMRAGDAVDVALTAQDPDVDELVLEGSQLPAFATVVDLGGGFGELRLRPDPGDVGLYSLVLVVSDQGIPPLASSRTCTVRVDETVLFADDFESGDLTAWSSFSGFRSDGGMPFYD